MFLGFTEVPYFIVDFDRETSQDCKHPRKFCGIQVLLEFVLKY